MVCLTNQKGRAPVITVTLPIEQKQILKYNNDNGPSGLTIIKE
jgi:hypothetical protein